MVVRINKFREHFAGYEDKYAIIGGTACHLWLNTAGLPFRATHDIDMVLCVEVVDAGFGAAFQCFLDSGGYRARGRGDGRKEFYRFHQPTDKNYPFMIELLARKPETLVLPEGTHLSPIPVEEDVASLSAILLDDAYYDALAASKRKVDGVSIAGVDLLIPFKARAFLNLSESKERGEKIDSKSIKKHLKDVFRLAQLLQEDTKVQMSEPIQEDMVRFLEETEADETLNPKDFNVPLTRDEGVSLLRSAYQLQ